MLKQIVGDLASLGPTGLLVLMILLMMTGKLVPSITVRRLVEAKQWQIDRLTQSQDRHLSAIGKLSETTELASTALSEIKERAV
jgi:hypothetical protein